RSPNLVRRTSRCAGGALPVKTQDGTIEHRCRIAEANVKRRVASQSRGRHRRNQLCEKRCACRLSTMRPGKFDHAFDQGLVGMICRPWKSTEKISRIAQP